MGPSPVHRLAWSRHLQPSLLRRAGSGPEKALHTLLTGTHATSSPFSLKRSPLAPGTHFCGFGRHGEKTRKLPAEGFWIPTPEAPASTHTPLCSGTSLRLLLSLTRGKCLWQTTRFHITRAQVIKAWPVGRRGPGSASVRNWPSVHFYFTCPQVPKTLSQGRSSGGHTVTGSRSAPKGAEMTPGRVWAVSTPRAGRGEERPGGAPLAVGQMRPGRCAEPGEAEQRAGARAWRGSGLLK